MSISREGQASYFPFSGVKNTFKPVKDPSVEQEVESSDIKQAPCVSHNSIPGYLQPRTYLEFKTSVSNQLQLNSEASPQSGMYIDSDIVSGDIFKHVSVLIDSGSS